MHLNVRNLFFACMVGVLILVSAYSAMAFTEGKDYTVLDKPLPDANGTLIKVYSYDCPFCYQYDKIIIPSLVEKTKNVVEYQPFHLACKATYGQQASELFAVLIIQDQSNGISLTDSKSRYKKALFAYYTAYHDHKERWCRGAEDFLVTGLTATGLTRDQFNEALTDSKVQELLQLWEGYAESLTNGQGIPALIVNGKFLINTKNIRSVDELAKLVKELAKKN